jgi:hypothetical protein
MASAGGSERESPGWLQLSRRRARSDYSKPNHAEEIRDVGDNVPPSKVARTHESFDESATLAKPNHQWEGRCPQRPIYFLRHAQTNCTGEFVKGPRYDRWWSGTLSSIRVP